MDVVRLSSAKEEKHVKGAFVYPPRESVDSTNSS